MRLLLCLFFAATSIVGFAKSDNFPSEVQLALSEIDNSCLISKSIPPANQEIMADYSVLEDEENNAVYYEAFYWNTATGDSRLYYFNTAQKKFVAYKESVQVPKSPLQYTAQGRIMADYIAVYAVSSATAFYEVLFWDTKTGNSSLYRYVQSSDGFELYNSSTQFPANPIGTPSGEVMACYDAVHIPSEDKTYYECLFYDTKTGRSELYYYNYSDNKFVAYNDDILPPAAPLGSNVSGEVRADYSMVNAATEGKTFYEILYWDTKTGNSRLYNYDYGTKKFELYGDNVQLPNNPLGSTPQGDIMIDYASAHDIGRDKTWYEALVWDTKSGKSKLYYFNYNQDAFVAYKDEIQLPKSTVADGVNYVMSKYTSGYSKKLSETYYEVLFLNTATGESEMFYYDYDVNNFSKYTSEQVPTSPF